TKYFECGRCLSRRRESVCYDSDGDYIPSDNDESDDESDYEDHKHNDECPLVYVDGDGNVYGTLDDDTEDEECKSDDEPEYFDIEKIIGYDPIDNQWLVKWKGFPLRDSTWEPYENLEMSTVFQEYLCHQ
ncbi:MAG: hypothetical protein ACXAEN_21950, partial [Candidatus Thorarchaeota archaeon]